MNKNPIIIVDDDDEDLEIIKEAFAVLKVENDIIVFNTGAKFLEYMSTAAKKPFFILCDMNLSGMINGIELKKSISNDPRLRLKCIPFLFASTSKASASIMEAYSFGVQGYFIKPNSLTEYTKMLNAIMVYWDYSQHPNT